MIKLHKPEFWDKEKISLFSILLFPLSLVILFVIFLKKFFLKVKDFDIPIICVGNIYIGGTGKTPTSIYLAKELSSLGLNPVIIRKYYKNHNDEYEQIKNNFNNLILDKDRIKGIIKAKEKGYKTIILDDGLQDYRIKKNLNIICFNYNQLIGNGLIIPAGPLRESLSALKNGNIILINGKKNQNFEKKLFNINKNLNIFYSNYRPLNLDEFKDHKLLAIAGIANPENFFKLLEENNLIIKEKFFFPDHYKFTNKEIQNIINIAKEKKLKIIMTEKDFYKMGEFKSNDLNYLRVSLEISNKEKLMEKIKKLYV